MAYANLQTYHRQLATGSQNIQLGSKDSQLKNPVTCLTNKQAFINFEMAENQMKYTCMEPNIRITSDNVGISSLIIEQKQCDICITKSIHFTEKQKSICMSCLFNFLLKKQAKESF